MQGVCTCSHCPSQASPFGLLKNPFTKLEKGLMLNRIEVDRYGVLTCAGELLDLTEDGRPMTGEPMAGVKALLQQVAIGERVGQNPTDIVDAGLEVLTQFYEMHRRNAALLNNLAVPLVEDPGPSTPDQKPVTFFELLVKGIGYGSPRSQELCLAMVRRMLRDDANRKRLPCLMWRRDQAKRQYLCVVGMNQLMCSKTAKTQEDATRVACVLCKSDEQVERLARIRSVHKSVLNALEKGTERAQAPPPPPLPLVLSGHAASFTLY